MAEITHKALSTIQKGNYILVDDIASIVSSVQVSRPGKHGHAKYRIEAVGIMDGKKRQMLTSDHEVECPIIAKKNAQVLSINGNKAQVMDMETYETYDMDIPSDMKGVVHEGCTILYWQVMNDKLMKQVAQKAE
ncbi:translation initiation factor IF-5A [Candidatus Woesearchaeota archaeon]|nr:translation initiation factor IF-5A [Candidatus Woesearchaeota archaeon]